MTLLLNGYVINDETLRQSIVEVLERRSKHVTHPLARQDAAEVITEWLSHLGKQSDRLEPIPGSADESVPTDSEKTDRVGERRVEGLAVPTDATGDFDWGND